MMPAPGDGTSLMRPLAFMALLLLAAPALPGIAVRVRALLTGRRGAPAWQLYADLWKLLGKGAVYSDATTWMFRLAPVVTLATAVVAAALLPVDGRRTVIAFAGDPVAFAGLLALGRFVLVLGALDTGSSFEGMGASRDATFAGLVEPGLFAVLVALGVATRQLSLGGMFGAELWRAWAPAAPAILLLAASLFVLMLAEGARVPVDDPATHLELTMIHEVAILDHGGVDLAFLLYAGALKLALFAVLVLDLVVPRGGMGARAAAATLLGGLAAAGAAVGVVEATTARVRLPKVAFFIAGGATLGLAGLILVLQ